MERLTQVLRRKDQSGEPLPDFLAALHNGGVRFRRAQTCLIVGQPGAGKSMMALYAALKSRVRTLYISADTDSKTMLWRAAACVMQTPVNEVASMIGTSADVLVEEALAEVDRHVVFDWTSNPRLSDIELETMAAEEAWGSFPQMIVIDNLMNVVNDEGGDDYSGMRHSMQAFHTLARKTGAAVVVLHHASLNRTKDGEPAPMNAIIGQVSALPEMILSVMMEDDTYKVAVVKNRHSKASAAAKRQIELAVSAETMTLFNDQAERRLAESRREWQ